MKDSEARTERRGEWTAADWDELILACRDAIPLARLLERALPRERLAALVRGHGVRLKGGFRPERAPAEVLAKALVEALPRADSLRAEIAAALPGGGEGSQDGPHPGTPARDPAMARELSRLEHELARARRDAETARSKADRAAARLEKERAKARRQAKDAQSYQAERNRLKKEFAACAKRLAELESELAALSDKDLGSELHAARRRIEELAGILEEERRAFAELKSERDRLAAEVDELLEFAPKGRRERARKRGRRPPAEEPARVLPVFEPSFLEALAALEPAVQRRVHQAIARAVLAGLSYPSLETKQLKGVDLWEFRAGLSHRVYFVLDEDRLLLKHVGTREDLDTYLRKASEA